MASFDHCPPSRKSCLWRVYELGANLLHPATTESDEIPQTDPSSLVGGQFEQDSGLERGWLPRIGFFANNNKDGRSWHRSL